jgi:hypothetical protein
MEIEISGYKVLIDDEDFEKVSRYKWHVKRSYLKRTGNYYFTTRPYINGKRGSIALHHYIFGDPPEGLYLDHINRNTLDNRKGNFRFTTPQQNKYNQKCRKDSTTGYKGVGVQTHCPKYIVKIVYDGKRHSLGTYSDPIEAARVYDRKALEVYGEYAATNFPREDYINEGAKE